MLIEQTTTYAYKLKYLENPSFDKVRNLAKKFIDELPKDLVDDLYNSINRGVDILKTEPEMLVYLYSFGNMHQAKLNFAFDKIPEDFFYQPEINIIDYGCGQAIGTMCYVDFIRQKNGSQKVKRVTLIEPSEICLKRAALHVSAFCPDADIVTINNTFEDLDAADIVCDEEIPTLHILSNVLDLEFDLERFAELISDNLKGYNQFVCVGPYFGFSDKDKRMGEFCALLNGEENYSKFFDKFELNPNKPWTAQIRCFSVGVLEKELSTKVTDEDIKNGVKDEYGVVYSRDGKRLLWGNRELKSCIVKNGTKVICDRAFYFTGLSKSSLQQITIPNSVTSNGTFANVPKSVATIKMEQINLRAKELIATENVPEADAMKRAKDEIHFDIRRGNKTGGLFFRCGQMTGIVGPSVVDKPVSELEVDLFTWTDDEGNVHQYVPCLKVISGCSSLQQITIPNSVTSIGNDVFYGCKTLQQIIIPEDCVEKFKQMLPERYLWDKLYYLKKVI